MRHKSVLGHLFCEKQTEVKKQKNKMRQARDRINIVLVFGNKIIKSFKKKNEL